MYNNVTAGAPTEDASSRDVTARECQDGPVSGETAEDEEGMS